MIVRSNLKWGGGADFFCVRPKTLPVYNAGVLHSHPLKISSKKRHSMMVVTQTVSKHANKSKSSVSFAPDRSAGKQVIQNTKVNRFSRQNQRK